MPASEGGSEGRRRRGVCSRRSQETTTTQQGDNVAKTEKTDTQVRAQLTKVQRLMVLLQEIREKEQAVLEEIDTILSGGVGIGTLMNQASKAWLAAWAVRYRGEYAWKHERDRPQIKRLVKSLGVEELTKRMNNYIRNSDPFFLQARHSFAAFVASINQHADISDAGDLELEAGPADCRHDPPCRTDQEHTRRRNADMRGEAPAA